MAMEKANLQKIGISNLQLQALKCPRCDSSNTKFCYYNNYSLTQPRHFCKACKRYWTRGGTLRNVPVGGSCRKNKRIRRPSSSSSTSSNSTSTSKSYSTSVHHHSSSSSIPINLPTLMEQPSSSPVPAFYNLPTNNSELVNLLYLNPTRFSDDLGLGFSPLDHSLLSGYIHNSSPLLEQQKAFPSSISDVNPLMPFQGMNPKQDETHVQEDDQNRLDWNDQLSHSFHTQMESDSSLYNWNASSSFGGGSCLDPQNITDPQFLPYDLAHTHKTHHNLLSFTCL